MVPPVIVCDLDSTLIDTKKIKEDLFALAEQNGATNVAGVYAHTFAQQLFSLEVFTQALFTDSVKAKEYLLQAQQLFQQPHAYTFSGAEDFCASASATHTLVLLTYGQKEFQLVKLRQSGLQTYFTEIIVTNERSKEKELLRLRAQYGSVLILDNSELVLATAKKLSIPYVHVQHHEGFKEA